MDTAVFAGIAGELGFQVADYGSCAFAGTGDLSLFLSRGRPLCTNRRIQVIYPAETGKKFLITYEKISLSKMTFSHQMVRVIFTEQIYRACTIIKGEPYHHE